MITPDLGETIHADGGEERWWKDSRAAAGFASVTADSWTATGWTLEIYYGTSCSGLTLGGFVDPSSGLTTFFPGPGDSVWYKLSAGSDVDVTFHSTL